MNLKHEHFMYYLVVVALSKQEIQRVECYFSLLLSW